MGQIVPDSFTHKHGFGGVPMPSRPQTMDFQADKGAYGEDNMIPLRPGFADLRPLCPTALFETAMVRLDGPTLPSQAGSLDCVHGQVIGGPVFRVTVWGDDPKDQDHAKTFEMDLSSWSWDGDRRQGDVAVSIRIDQPVVLQPGQKVPAMSAHRFEVLHTAVPAIKTNELGGEAARFRCGQHRPEMLVLGLTVGQRLIVDAAVTGQGGGPIGPDHGEQVDPRNHLMMLAAPMACDEFDVPGIGFVQGRIIQDEQASRGPHIGTHLLPQRRRVGRLSMQQADKRIMRRGVRGRRSALRGFGTGVDALRSDQKLDIFNVSHFWWIHTASVSRAIVSLSTA